MQGYPASPWLKRGTTNWEDNGADATSCADVTMNSKQPVEKQPNLVFLAEMNSSDYRTREAEAEDRFGSKLEVVRLPVADRQPAQTIEKLQSLSQDENREIGHHVFLSPGSDDRRRLQHRNFVEENVDAYSLDKRRSVQRKEHERVNAMGRALTLLLDHPEAP